MPRRSTPTGRTSSRTPSYPSPSCFSGEVAAGKGPRRPGDAFADLPATRGADENVVVMPKGINPIRRVVGLQHQHGVDIRAHRRPAPGLIYADNEVRHAVVR